MSPRRDDDTDEMPALPEPDSRPVAGASSLVEVDLAALSHPGRVRDPTTRITITSARVRPRHADARHERARGRLPDHVRGDRYAMLVADGVGGAAAGEVASRTAIQALVDLVIETPDWIMRLDDRLADEVLQRMERRFQRVRETPDRQAKADPKLHGMATTMTVAALWGRSFSLRTSETPARTCSAREAPRTADAGPDDGPVARRRWGDPREEIATSPCRNVLTSALATRGAFVQVELKTLAAARRRSLAPVLRRSDRPGPGRDDRSAPSRRRPPRPTPAARSWTSRSRRAARTT